MRKPTVPSSEDQFRRLLEKLPAVAYTCDANGLITYFNQHAVRLWGREPKLNDTIDRFCGSFKLFAADGTPIPHDKCWMALALQTGKEYNGEEILIERPDGSRLVALAHANPLFDESGQVVGAVNVLIDITERKHAGDAREFLAAIVESSDDAIISKTLDGRILSWNSGAQRLFGYTAHEAIGSPITLIIPPDRQGEEQTILARLRRGERIEHYETVRRAKDDRLIDISLSISPIRNDAGQIIGASKVARDITARKQGDAELQKLTNQLETQLDDLQRMHVQLREADRRKDEFLATLAHELRNPLAPITNALHILRLSGELSPTTERVREIMERQINHMVRLVDDLLEVSRIKRDKIELRKEHVELAAILRSAVETSRPLIDSAGHQLAITIPPEPILLEADAVRLAQVVANVLNNAAKYTPEGGQIWLSARCDGREAVVSVRDNGMGISDDILPRVFDMYAQADETLSRSQGGLGIGLTLAKNLVHLHDGQIEAHSAGPGQGSEFVVRLPLATLSVRSAAPPVVPFDQNAPLPPRRILIVDDTRDSVYVLGKLLEKLGQQVLIAHDPAAALEAARAQCPDVVISDIAMPKMDGFELARRLRQELTLGHSVLVALTGYGQEAYRQRTKDAGFDYHLVKPVGLDALQKLLRSLPAPPKMRDLKAHELLG